MSSFLILFFFKQKTAYEMRISDWSSDVCSSDLPERSSKDATHEQRHHDAAERRITVTQGTTQVTTDPNVVLTTVLGSCVAACLFDGMAGVGGMNHFLQIGTA